MTDTLLRRVMRATGWTADDLAKPLKISASTVKAYASGRRTELLSDDQKATILAGLQVRRDKLDVVIKSLGEDKQ